MLALARANVIIKLQKEFVIMETLRRRMLATVLVVSLGLTACGSSDEGDNPAEVRTSGIEVAAEYFEDGTRIVRLKDDGNYYSDIYGRCDGLDLVEQTRWNDSGAGNAITRSVGHTACADGRLTPEDFAIPA
jgi:hypothetical protein